MNKKKAQLILEDGTVFEGHSFGAEKSVSGEVVFNTGMVGYPESLTDPSYRGQILTLTYPLIGNYGVPAREHYESEKPQITALIVSDYSGNYHHWNAQHSLQDWLKKENIPAIQGVDTRELTKKLREKGVMLGKIIFEEDIPIEDPNKKNLVAEVSIKQPIIYEAGKKRVLLIDCGTKQNIIRCLLKRDVTVVRVPWNHDISQEKFDGILISNGPGNPKMCKETIIQIKKAIQKEIPILGICLGNQILGLAAGADTYKLKYGHRSQNQPCIDIETKKCYITSQNHGYAINQETLPQEWKPYFINANDNTNEGIKHKTKPFFSIQFHPEASCGPVDTEYLFDKFLEQIK